MRFQEVKCRFGVSCCFTRAFGEALIGGVFLFKFDRAPTHVPSFRGESALLISSKCKDWLPELNEVEFSALTLKVSNLV